MRRLILRHIEVVSWVAPLIASIIAIYFTHMLVQERDARVRLQRALEECRHDSVIARKKE